MKIRLPTFLLVTVMMLFTAAVLCSCVENAPDVSNGIDGSKSEVTNKDYSDDEEKNVTSISDVPTAEPEKEITEDNHSENEEPDDKPVADESADNEPVEELSRSELVEQLVALMSDLRDQYQVTSWGPTYDENPAELYCGIGCYTQEDVDALEKYLLELGYDSSLFRIAVQNYGNPC